MTKDKEDITPGSGDVFKDIGIAPDKPNINGCIGRAIEFLEDWESTRQNTTNENNFVKRGRQSLADLKALRDAVPKLPEDMTIMESDFAKDVHKAECASLLSKAMGGDDE